ncbi:hypothetical protein [Schnuerera sp.]|uniref:YncE family protein n=1 Tax=Schnuerera sp. TaxID=2794844 RepID=UPI002D0E3C3E|nr:hypothetical protein [Schnuerera sp.]HSH36775.1 hypothetical protein [Schnuerera sp.]
MTAVPNTNSFNLQDVYNSVSSHASPGNNLQSCFDNAESSYFDPTYNTDSYAPANSMLRFRNYTPVDDITYETTYSLSVPNYVQDLWFNPTGTKLFLVTSTSGVDGHIYSYDLSTPWDVSTYTSWDVYIISPKENIVQGIYIEESGLNMYIVGSYSDSVKQYSLNPAYNATNPTYIRSFSVANEGNYPTDIFFKPDGTKMYIINNDNGSDIFCIYTYSLAIAWDISTAFLTSQLFDVFTGTVTDIFFDSTGRKMYLTSFGTNTIHQYYLSFPWVPSVSNLTRILNTSLTNNLGNTGIFITPDGSKLFVVEYDHPTGYIHVYNL